MSRFSDEQDDDFSDEDDAAEWGAPLSWHTLSWTALILQFSKAAGGILLGLFVIFVVVPVIDRMAMFNPPGAQRFTMWAGSWVILLVACLGIVAAIVGLLKLLIVLRTDFATGQEVQVYPEGLVDTRGDESAVYCWEDIEAVTLKSSFLGGGLSITCDSEEIEFTDCLTSFLDLGNQIEHFTCEPLLAQTMDEFAREGEAEFAKISVSTDGLTCKGRYYPWPEIWKVTSDGGTVKLYGFRQRSALAGQDWTPNTHVMSRLLAHLRKPDDPPAGAHKWDRKRLFPLVNCAVGYVYGIWQLRPAAWVYVYWSAILLLGALYLRPWPPFSGDRPRHDVTK